MVFNLPSQQRSSNPPEFTLSFSVIIAPPTYVKCHAGSLPVEIVSISRQVTDGVYVPELTASSPVTLVSVTLRTRQAGDYQCTISVFRASGANLSVATTNQVQF